ncbi:winged helix-turn-helix domain-containing protein [Sediminitomix flava]|uniref:Winged helix DNA-binding protein n=1 Tax=Sediminitomix flava TaxID=379075 RepID=A0A315ZTI6_SEDFL|nr:crosslink repair DNA glycosylase YcaQ family protein [Sediminitomix flava]PWJ38544.1 hypothetical protein BC781_107134 [Sediminitomix flava]
MNELSLEEAQKIILQSQKILSEQKLKSPLEDTLSNIEHLGYIQIDTISAVERAHHHTLWNRNENYQSSHLDTLVENRQVFEYWSHAAAYLPMRDYKYTLIRKHAIGEGKQRHWYDKDEVLMSEVLKRIEQEGPLMAKDFESTKKKSAWASKPTKRALEYLFMQGDLMISSRKNFHKVYDLTERVLPSDIDTKTPSHEEYIRFLIISYLRANGIGQASEIAYLLKNTKTYVSKILKEMESDKELMIVQIKGTKYYSLPNAIDLLNQSFSKKRVKILSPFDNFLIQRKRMLELFDFDYKIECYLPEAKRKYGYFSLPVLWDGKLVARMDCKAERKTAIFHIKHLAFETDFSLSLEFKIAFQKEVELFMTFNACRKLELHQVTPNLIKKDLQDMAIFPSF